MEYDRDAAKRTSVIDDQSDYFEIDTNSWLTDEVGGALFTCLTWSACRKRHGTHLPAKRLAIAVKACICAHMRYSSELVIMSSAALLHTVLLHFIALIHLP